MSVAIFLLSFPPISSAVIHSLQYFYTASSGISGLPEFISVGQVNGIDISYYDSSSRKGVPKQDWMKFDQTYWLKETEVAREYERAFKKDMGILKDRFNQTRGVHVFQKMYGCQWDDETDVPRGFEQFGYDGEDFMSLDLKNLRWIAVVPQALATKDKWNRMENAFGYRKNYFQKDCVEWLKEYVGYGSSTLGSKVPPEVSLFQKGSTGPVVCHATGFYPEGVMITWKRDGEEMQDDVDVGEMLPNEDGTFQKRSVLTVSPEERKKHQYSCQVTHRSGEPTVLMFHEEGNSLPVVVSVIVTAAALLVGVIVAVVIKKKKGYTKASQSDTSSDTSNGAPKAGHVFQKMYGCQWDDETDVPRGFEQFGYDGEDFMSLDLNNLRWIAVVPQALATKDKWNRMENAFGYRKNYFQKDCVEWLKEYVGYGSSTLGSKVPPEVSLFQKGSTGPVVCHATGFYPEGVMITWKRDGEEMQDDVDVGEMLPNEDGTFQKRAVLTVSPEERKKHQYSCQVTHKSGEPTVLMFHEEGNSLPVVPVCVILAVLVVVGIVAVVIKKKKGYTKASQSDTSSDTSNGAPKA